MRAKERLLKELDSLSHQDILKVYDLVLTLKGEHKPRPEREKGGYMRARRALKDCSGSLSDDIREGRNERI